MSTQTNRVWLVSLQHRSYHLPLHVLQQERGFGERRNNACWHILASKLRTLNSKPALQNPYRTPYGSLKVPLKEQTLIIEALKEATNPKSLADKLPHIIGLDL